MSVMDRFRSIFQFDAPESLPPDITMQAFLNFADSRAGQIVLDYMREACFMDSTTFCPGDPQGTAFNEGRRSVFLDIQRIVRAAEEKKPVASDTLKE